MSRISEELCCCGCLSFGRRMELVRDIANYQCFLDIINEMQDVKTNETEQLCWECKAMLHKFSKFKQRVRHSYIKFKDHIKQEGLQTRLEIKHASNLNHYNLFEIYLNPDVDNEENVYVYKRDTVESIKAEPRLDIDESFKLEHEDNISISSDCNNEDDKLPIVLSKRKKKKMKLNGNVKKKKHKEVLEVYKEISYNKEEIEQERLLALNKEEIMNAMFKCEKCILPFPNADDLKDHVTSKHNSVAPHKCNICECTFNTEMSYSYHTNKHVKRYKCTVCSDVHASKRSACKHYYTVHHQYTPLDYDLERTKVVNDSVQAESSFPCPSCEKTFRWKTSLRKHLETHRIETGEKRKPYCEPCRLSFTNTSNLQKHVKTSSKHQIQLKLRKLKMEDSTPEKKEVSIEEIKCSINSSREVFPCPQCDKRFQWRGNLLRHLDSHAARANGELVCEPCKRTFSSIATYKQHMKISKKHVSENEFKYMCSDCGKRFANKTRLKDHINWEHLKNYVHTCPQCQKVFKSHSSLYLHKQVVHKKGNSEHLCHHCGKSFPNHANLRSHVTALHTRDAPHRCGACGARFSWHSCLSRHVRCVHKDRRGRDT